MKVSLNCSRPSMMFRGEKSVKTEAQVASPKTEVKAPAGKPVQTASQPVAPKLAGQPAADTVVIAAKQPEAKKCEGAACKK